MSIGILPKDPALRLLHAADKTKPLQTPLGKQGEHARCTCQGKNALLLWAVVPGDAKDPSKAV